MKLSDEIKMPGFPKFMKIIVKKSIPFLVGAAVGALWSFGNFEINDYLFSFPLMLTLGYAVLTGIVKICWGKAGYTVNQIHRIFILGGIVAWATTNTAMSILVTLSLIIGQVVKKMFFSHREISDSKSEIAEELEKQ